VGDSSVMEENFLSFEFNQFMNEPAIILLPKEKPSNDNLLQVRLLLQELLKYIDSKGKLPIGFEVEIGDANPPQGCKGSETGEHLLTEMFNAPDGLGTLVCVECGARFHKKSGMIDFRRGKALFRESV
jgi:hypothetical protein